MNSKLIFAAALAASTNASILCSIDDYADYIVSFAQGFQSDTTSTSTDCYSSSDSFVTSISSLTTGISNFKTSDWLAPLYLAQEALVEMTAVFSDCQTTNAAK